MSLPKMKTFSSNECPNVCCLIFISYSVCRFKIRRRCVLSSHRVKGMCFLTTSPQSLHLSASYRNLKIYALSHRQRDPVPSQEAFSHFCQSIHSRRSSLFSPPSSSSSYFSLCNSPFSQHSLSFSIFFSLVLSPHLHPRRSHESPNSGIHVASLSSLHG